MAPDTHTHRETILDWNNEKVEAFITSLQERRLLARKKLEHAEKLAKQVRNERERDRALKAFEIMTAAFDRVEKQLKKVDDKWAYIRMLAMQENIDIFKDAPPQEVESEGA